MKKILEIKLKPSEIKNNFINPRKISSERLANLRKSIELFGDFGILVVDENNNVVSGNQRLKILKDMKIDEPVLCKKLIGYTDAEKKAINLKSNDHEGEFDLEKLNLILLEIGDEFEIDFNIPEIEKFNIDFDLKDDENFYQNGEENEKEKQEQKKCPKCGFTWRK